MIIPLNNDPDTEDLDEDDYQKIGNAWENTAIKMSIEYGVFVRALCDLESNKLFVIKRIWFQVGSHEFESLKELRRALRNPALL